MSAIWFGLVGLLMGLFILAISGPLANLATKWNLFIRQDADVLEAYRSQKRRGVRLVATLFLVVGGGAIIAGLIGWSLGAP